MQFAKSLFNRIHHHIWTADEVLMVGIWRRQMPPEHLSVNTSLLTCPASRRITQHVDDCQVKPLFQRFQLFTEGNRFPVPAAVEQDYGPFVTVVSERTEHAHHRGDSNTAGDQHMHVRRVADSERTVRSIEVDALANRHLVNLAR